MIGYPPEELLGEVAFLAYYLHWPHEQLMKLEHRERQLWVAEVSKINRQLNESEASEY